MSARANRTAAVVAFPPGGGGAGMFAALRKALPDGVGLTVPDLPGRGRRTRAPEALTVAGLAAEIVTELEPTIAERPYAVFATCFGTIVGLEVVWQALERGLPAPRVLVVSGRRPPDTAPGFEPLDRRSDAEILDRMGRAWPPGMRDMAPQLQALMLRQIRRDNALGLGYAHRPRGPLPVPVVALHGADDPELEAAHMDDWRAHTTSAFRFRLVPGGHYFYLSRPGEPAEELTAPLG
ncbi:thioesterase [Sphaerisporangium krabiense]|uniref:Surfactin synthase thioesterase subunit n=1 Tax=Sphaerisporangium krabiense TaxID=763782 RepID=A0A7W9DPQ4_9ACTN|nr:alpha/beta fold hydrolase [Sphaerisporangium krabiense]MBB5626214.1 surfactin synthase thioesterase subunit [Sphaerisporangium krabiense]GII66119.1 thioesterase [Sphaerisporangium krabiense]